MGENKSMDFSFRIMRVRNVYWRVLGMRIVLEGSLISISLTLRSLVDEIFRSSIPYHFKKGIFTLKFGSNL